MTGPLVVAVWVPVAEVEAEARCGAGFLVALASTFWPCEPRSRRITGALLRGAILFLQPVNKPKVLIIKTYRG